MLDITVGVPCYNSADTLPVVLDALAKQTHGPSEIICADDGSDDGTPEIVKDYPEVRLIQHEENKGLGSARNTILDHSDTPLLGMVDDDIVPDKEWLETLIDTIQREDAAIVSARIEESIACRADRWRKERMQANPYDDGGTVPQVAGGNFLVRVGSVQKVGRWPDDGWNSEDMALCKKLREDGQTIYYEPTVSVTHLEEDTATSVLRRLWRWHLNSPDDVSSPRDFFKKGALPLNQRLRLYCRRHHQRSLVGNSNYTPSPN